MIARITRNRRFVLSLLAGILLLLAAQGAAAQPGTRMAALAEIHKKEMR